MTSPGNRSGSLRTKLLWAAAGVVVIGVLVGGVLQIRTEPKSGPTDQSCHRPLQPLNGLSMPYLDIDLDAPPADGQSLTGFLRQFTTDRGLDFQDMSLDHEAVRMLDISACDESVRLVVTEQRWQRYGFKKSPTVADRGIGITLYLRLLDSDRSTPYSFARELVEQLDEHWPGRVRFRREDGSLIPRDRAMSVWEGYWTGEAGATPSQAMRSP